VSVLERESIDRWLASLIENEKDQGDTDRVCDMTNRDARSFKLFILDFASILVVLPRSCSS
jgi:hypothetical protein